MVPPLHYATTPQTKSLWATHSAASPGTQTQDTSINVLYELVCCLCVVQDWIAAADAALTHHPEYLSQ